MKGAATRAPSSVPAARPELPPCLVQPPTPRSLSRLSSAVAERRLSDALALLRRLERLLSRFVAAADAGDPAQQVGGQPSASHAGSNAAGVLLPLHTVYWQDWAAAARVPRLLTKPFLSPLPPVALRLQARLDSLSGEVERRREALIAISEQQVLQVGGKRTRQRVCCARAAKASIPRTVCRQAEGLWQQAAGCTQQEVALGSDTSCACPLVTLLSYPLLLPPSAHCRITRHLCWC